jgi:hypothetical protein
MKKIPLSGKLGEGKYALVDDDDFERFGLFKWNLRKKSVSRNVMNGGKQHTEILSRLITSCGKGWFVDHINGDIFDNRKSNLRLCSPMQNTWNKASSGHNTSGYKGVSFKKKRDKFYAYITVNKDVKHLGVYPSAVLAAIAYNVAARKYYGEFAKLNDVWTII